MFDFDHFWGLDCGVSKKPKSSQIKRPTLEEENRPFIIIPLKMIEIRQIDKCFMGFRGKVDKGGSEVLS